MSRSLFFSLLLGGLLSSTCYLLSCQQQPIATVDENRLHNYSLQSGPLALWVDTLIGGRITSFTYEGKEILQAAMDTIHGQWGSTISLGSEAEGEQAIFNRRAYTVTAKEAQKITLMSDVDPQSGLQLVKNIRLAEDERWGHVATLRYRLYNRGQSSQSVYLLENTRLPYQGKIVLPKGGHWTLAAENAPILIDSNGQSLELTLDNRQPDGQQLFFYPAPSDAPYFGLHYACNGLVFSKSWRLPTTLAPVGTSVWPPANKSTISDPHIPSPEQVGVRPGPMAPVAIGLAVDDQFATLHSCSNFKTLAPEEYIELTMFWTLRPE